jgi:hypothetical protein
MTRVKDGQNCALTEPNDKQKPLKKISSPLLLDRKDLR